MANTNFTAVVAPALVVDFKQLVLDAATEAGAILTEEEATGQSQAWFLKGWSAESKKISVIAYDSGKINFQGLNPTRCGLDVRVINRWANTPKKAS